MRQMKSPLERVETLSQLRANYVNTPDFGIVNDLATRHRHQDFCVVWFSFSRNERMKLSEANDRFPKNFAIMFHGTVGVSYRAYHIGDNVYWTRHTNSYSWNTTASGSIEHYVKTCYHHYHPTIHLPWFSIDYSHSSGVSTPHESSLYAIDFTLQPSIRNSIVSKYVDRRKVVSLLKRARRYFEGKTC